MKNVPSPSSFSLADATSVLKHYWGFDQFRPGQDTVVEAILHKKDVLVLFPTGGGKSLCYQVPAITLPGLALVISPLLALMSDQVEQLLSKGIKATMVNSTIASYETEQRLVNARNGMYHLLYCSPERLQNPLFQSYVQDLPISFVAIDEAHCISEWGHRFRPSYRKIREHLDVILPNIPVMALTATATPKVRKDIQEVLVLKDPVVVSKGYIRENLYYRVEHTHQPQQRLGELLERTKSKGSGLIYGSTRKECEELATFTSELGLACKPYHAGKSDAYRTDVQLNWIKGIIPWVAATNAFGMGIDKPDCRFVFHSHPPASLEAYYQEAGRAGRDGKASYPVLLWSEGDFDRLRRNIDRSNPSFDQLNRTYQVMCDTFELSLGEELQEPKALSLENLEKRSGLPKITLVKSLEVLDHFGVIELMLNVRPSVGIQWQLSRDGLLNLCESFENPRKREFVDKLQRLLGPSAQSQMEFLELSVIHSKLDITTTSLKKALHLLEVEQILQFEWRENDPVLSMERVRESKVPISKNDIDRYRSILIEKVRFMERYCTTKECRNRFLSSYFGDIQPEYECGNCDNCRSSTTSQIEINEEFSSWLMKKLAHHPMNMYQIQEEYTLDSAQLNQTLQWLLQKKWIRWQDEKKKVLERH